MAQLPQPRRRGTGRGEGIQPQGDPRRGPFIALGCRSQHRGGAGGAALRPRNTSPAAWLKVLVSTGSPWGAAPSFGGSQGRGWFRSPLVAVPGAASSGSGGAGWELLRSAQVAGCSRDPRRVGEVEPKGTRGRLRPYGSALPHAGSERAQRLRGRGLQRGNCARLPCQALLCLAAPHAWVSPPAGLRDLQEGELRSWSSSLLLPPALRRRSRARSTPCRSPGSRRTRSRRR